MSLPSSDYRLDTRGLRPGDAAEGQGIVLESGIWVPGNLVRSLTSADATVDVDLTDPLNPDLSVAGSPAALPVGGATANTLAKVSGVDYDADWIPSSVPVILLPAGSDATDVPAGTPVGTIVLIEV